MTDDERAIFGDDDEKKAVDAALATIEKQVQNPCFSSAAESDPEHLALLIGVFIRVAEHYRVKEGRLSPEAHRALDRAMFAAEKLDDKLSKLRAKLDSVAR